MALIKQKWLGIILFLILLAGIWFRLVWYGDIRLSIANAETGSYIESSRTSTSFWLLFANNRPLTTNIIYKIAIDGQRCPITAYSTPAIGVEVRRALQPCFDQIAVLQNIVSILGWCLLAVVTVRRLNNPFTKITLAIIILLFGFTPQIAEWDSILSPESLSISMFVISFALLQELVFRYINSNNNRGLIMDYLLASGCLIIYILWVFVRDIHLYSIVISLILILLALPYKKFLNQKIIYAAVIILAGVFILGFISAGDGLRATRGPLQHSFETYIWPFQNRIAFFERFGMPDRAASGFDQWFDKNAAKTYGLFLLTHPGFVTTTLWENYYQLISDYSQPYFVKSSIMNRVSFLKLGESIHPQTGALYLVVILLLISVIMSAIKQRESTMIAWSWLTAWFFLTSVTTLFLGFFGDVPGMRRHIFPSVEMVRLLFWIVLFLIIDQNFELQNRRLSLTELQKSDISSGA